MVVIYLFLFCSSLYSADFNGVFRSDGLRLSSVWNHGFPAGASSYAPMDKLKPGMWGTPGYAVQTQELGLLTDENIRTPFFVELKEQSNEEKRKMLELVTTYPRGDCNYHKRRRNIAAVVKIAETDPKVVQKKFHPDFLWQAGQNKDIALVRLLLEAGADVHEGTMFLSMPTTIHIAKSVPFAQLLEEYGAFKHENASLLLHTAMYRDYDIALVSYYKEQYKKHHLSLLGVDMYKDNVLMSCVFKIHCLLAKDETIEKVKVLLQDLPDETVMAMINYTNDDGKNVMQYIQRQSETASGNTKKVLASLRTLLQSRLDSACNKESKKEDQEVVECAICFDSLLQDIVEITKCCKQSLHGACLQKWIVLGNGCPLCRSVKPE